MSEPFASEPPAFSTRRASRGTSTPRRLGILLYRLFVAPDAWAVNVLSFLAGRASLMGEIHPFGIALFFITLRTGHRVRAISTALSVLAGLATVAGPGRVLSVTVALLAAYLLQRTRKSSSDPVAWPGALELAGLLAITRLGESYVLGVSARSVAVILLEATMVLLATVLFAPLARLVREEWPYRLHTEQLVSVGLAAVVVGMGLGGLSVGPIQLSEVWNRWVTLVAALLGHGAIGAAQGVALGVMSELSSLRLLGGGVGVYGISGLLGGLFSKGGKAGVIAGFLVGNLIASVQAVSGESIVWGFAHSLAAIIFFMLTPERFVWRLARAIPGTEAEIAVAAAREDHLRETVTERLEQLSGIFGELAGVFAEVHQAVPRTGQQAGDLSMRLQQAHQVVPNQLRGLQQIAAHIAGQVRIDTGRSEEFEARVSEELMRRHIPFGELRVLHAAGEHPEVSLIYSGACDGEGLCCRQVAQAVTSALIEAYTPWQVECKGRQGGCRLRLLPERPYELIVRGATLAKEPGGISGDTYAKAELADGKVALLLSDGMGVGPRAALESRATVTMLQRLISVGFDREFAVQTVNSVMLLRSLEETYATLDLAVIDLFSGELEFLKIASAPSFIRHNREIEVIRSNSLPVGILSDIKVPTQRSQLHPGDILVMATDGVLDALPERLDAEEWLARYIRRDPGDDAMGLAESLLTLSGEKAGEIRDDMTVVVAKLVRRTADLEALLRGDLPVFHRHR